VPNVFTVLADVGAAFLLVAHGPAPIGRFVLVLLAGVALYWAGMILNDVFDVQQDRQERPDRPLAAGQIPLRQATWAGWGSLLVGIGLAGASGRFPSVDHAATWLPGAVGVALAVMIVAYDGPLKKTPLAPAAMGGCRLLSFLLGAAPCVALLPPQPLVFPKYVIAIALGFGIYVMGITTMARHEASGGANPNLATGLLVMIIGAALLAFAPSTAEANLAWRVDPDRHFPILIGLIVFPVILRGIRLQGDPSAARIQDAIRAGVLTIIPLAAAFALLGAGRLWGLIVFALVVPALFLAIRLRVT
jgi:4-hydroxybenzoate polyprenyltransferase